MGEDRVTSLIESGTKYKSKNSDTSIEVESDSEIEELNNEEYY